MAETPKSIALNVKISGNSPENKAGNLFRNVEISNCETRPIE